MNIDRGSFLILVSTLAIGGASGYVVAEKRLFPALDRWRGRPPEPSPEPPRPIVVADAAPPAATAPPPPPPAAPACDDSVGVAEACPPPGYPTIEGGCGSFANTRCGELKQGMKPKVAQTAVACLNKLTPQERCDATRVTLCGHLAFMNACPEREAEIDAGASTNANASAGAGAAAGAHSVASTCQAIITACGTSSIAPALSECKQLLSGMTEAGRERTQSCMKKHCFDRGLIGCEAVVNPK